MGITKRQTQILNTLIEEYVNSAQPVSSQLLEKKYDFEICPATIRIEMQKLTDKGFLCQPHTSAGRVPTDKGYRFFVDNLLAHLSFAKQNFGGEDFEIEDLGDELRSSPPFANARVFEDEAKRTLFSSSPSLRSVIKDNIKFIQVLTKNLAQISGTLALSYLEKEKVFWKEGWEEILKEPEFGEKDFAVNFAEFLENFENDIENFEINSRIKIYIGKENPFKKAKDFSLISSRCHLPNDDGIICLLGPKRMAYDKNISLINSLIKLLDNH